MFIHSVRVPRLYKNAAKIVQKIYNGSGSAKQYAYENTHENCKAIYALVLETLKHMNQIDIALKKSKLLIKEPRLDEWLTKVLITELLWRKQVLPGDSKPVKTILTYEQILRAHVSDVADVPTQKSLCAVEIPRYVRVNTLRLTVDEAIDRFCEESWSLVSSDNSDRNYAIFLDQVAALGSYDFLVDVHIPDMLVFPPRTEFHRHAAYRNGSIFLQDKASCIPVHLLNPEPGSVVLDMCAAPGMKTTQLAARLNDNGTVYAVEVNEERFQSLKDIVELAGVTCVKPINRDILTLTGTDFPDVDYILVDPSCSGSGMAKRVDWIPEDKIVLKNRLAKLAGFQIMTLRHALNRFPTAKRVVYSTCSIYPEENEDVVRQVLETCTNFKLIPAGQNLNGWQNYGSSDFGDIGKYCLYAKPEDDFTNGFFVAVFERLAEGESNPFINRELFKLHKKQNHRSNNNNNDRNYFESNENMNYDQNNEVAGEEMKKKQRRNNGKKKQFDSNEKVIEAIVQNKLAEYAENSNEQEVVLKKKGKKHIKEIPNQSNGESTKDEVDQNRIKNKKEDLVIEAESVEEELVDKKNKSKKHRKVNKEEYDEPERSNNSMDENNDQKKKKLMKVDEEKPVVVKDRNFDENKKSKKHRKVNQEEPERSNNYMDESNDQKKVNGNEDLYGNRIKNKKKNLVIEAESVEEELVDKKKKSKKHRKVNKEEWSEPERSNNSMDENNGQNKKKLIKVDEEEPVIVTNRNSDGKKISKKHRTDVNQEETQRNTNSMDETNDRKKKKKKLIDVDEKEPVVVENGNDKKRESKKKRHREDLEINQSEECEEAKKEKKKRKKEQNDDLVVADEECDKSTKRKYKQDKPLEEIEMKDMMQRKKSKKEAVD